DAAELRSGFRVLSDRHFALSPDQRRKINTSYGLTAEIADAFRIPLRSLRTRRLNPLSPQVGVGFIDPVGAGRVKNVEIDGIRERLGPVRHVGRNGQNFARIHHNLFAIDPEFQRAFQDVSDLLVVMAVLRNDASLLEQDASEHDVLPDHEVAAKQGVQNFDFDRTPRDVTQFGRDWLVSWNSAFEGDFTRRARGARRFSGGGCFSGSRFQFFLFHKTGQIWEWPSKRYNKRHPTCRKTFSLVSCALPWLDGAGNLEIFQVYERGLSYEKASVPSGNRGGSRRHQPRQTERSALPADLSDFDLRGHRPAGAGARHSYRQLLHTLRQSHAYGRREGRRRTGRHGRGAAVLFRHGRD